MEGAHDLHGGAPAGECREVSPSRGGEDDRDAVHPGTTASSGSTADGGTDNSDIPDFWRSTSRERWQRLSERQWHWADRAIAKRNLAQAARKRFEEEVCATEELEATERAGDALADLPT